MDRFIFKDHLSLSLTSNLEALLFLLREFASCFVWGSFFLTGWVDSRIK